MLLDSAKAVEGWQGRSTSSPRMKLTLWLYAVSRGIGSAREIARLTRQDDGFRWIVGDLSVHHDTLSEFRARSGAAFDQLLTDILAALMHKGVLSLELVAQDGMRVRACATAPSFRSDGSLLQCREQAALHLKAVLATDDPEQSAREHVLADANHTGHEGIRVATERGVELIAAVPDRSQHPGRNASSEPSVAAWRARIETDEAQRLYRARASLCEHTRGIDPFLVRGLTRVTSVVLLGAIATNLLQHAATLLA